MAKPKKGTKHPRPSTTDRLELPAVGMESEFNVWIDGEEVVPDKIWSSPQDFFEEPLIPRVNSSFQLPSGGAVYFDRGVIEVVTPVIEIGPRSAARVARSLWEQIGEVRNALSRWEERTGRSVRLRGYSTHYNISYEVPPEGQTRRRSVKTLALLLAYILPPPLMVLATNRLSTGIGVRPRGDRIEITLDFTPDPALMVATATAIIGIVREAMSWQSYELEAIERAGLPRLVGVVPGKHTTRKGWLTKDVHYPRSPFLTSPDAVVWECTDGTVRSLREIGLVTARYFRESIERFSDPFAVRLLFNVLEGKERSMLDLADRPPAYEHVGVLCRWGRVLTDFLLRRDSGEVSSRQVASRTVSIRRRFTRTVESSKGEVVVADERAEPDSPEIPPRERRSSRGTVTRERRVANKRSPVPYPDRGLSRSLYERVFLELTSGRSLLVGNERWSPVGMESWYRAKFRTSNGRETTMTIDELTRHLHDWK